MENIVLCIFNFLGLLGSVIFMAFSLSEYSYNNILITASGLLIVVSLISIFSTIVSRIEIKKAKTSKVTTLTSLISSLILHVFFAIIGIVFLVETILESILLGLFLLIISIVGIIFSLIVFQKTSKSYIKKLDEKARQEGYYDYKEKLFRQATYRFNHVSGLPIMEGAICTLKSERDKIVITSQGTLFNLEKSKIKFIKFEDNEQIYSQAVSNGNMAAAGTLIGGVAVGLAIGGGNRSENFTSKKKYLVITYSSDEENAKYIIFDYKYEAKKLIEDLETYCDVNKKAINININ